MNRKGNAIYCKEHYREIQDYITIFHRHNRNIKKGMLTKFGRVQFKKITDILTKKLRTNKYAKVYEESIKNEKEKTSDL